MRMQPAAATGREAAERCVTAAKWHRADAQRLVRVKNKYPEEMNPDCCLFCLGFFGFILLEHLSNEFPVS